MKEYISKNPRRKVTAVVKTPLPTVQVYINGCQMPDNSTAYGAAIFTVDRMDVLSGRLKSKSPIRALTKALIEALTSLQSHKKSNVFINYQTDAELDIDSIVDTHKQLKFKYNKNCKFNDPDLWKEFNQLDKKHNLIFRHFDPLGVGESKTQLDRLNMAQGLAYYARSDAA